MGTDKFNAGEILWWISIPSMDSPSHFTLQKPDYELAPVTLTQSLLYNIFKHWWSCSLKQCGFSWFSVSFFKSTPCASYIHVVHGKHMLSICPAETSSSFRCLLLLFTSPFSDAACPFVLPWRTVIGKTSTRFLLLFLRFTKKISRNIRTVTNTPPKKLPSAMLTELIGLLEPSLRPGEWKNRTF